MENPGIHPVRFNCLTENRSSLLIDEDFLLSLNLPTLQLSPVRNAHTSPPHEMTNTYREEKEIGSGRE